MISDERFDQYYRAGISGHGLGQHVGAGMPIGLAVGLVFKSILVVFFRHDSSSLYWGRQIKNAPPLIVFRGEALKLHGSTLLAGMARRL